MKIKLTLFALFGASVITATGEESPHEQGGCACSTGRFIAEHVFPPTR